MHRTPSPRRSGPGALLLDALGTLVALTPPAPRLRLQLSTRFGVEVTPEQAERAIAAEISYYRSHFDRGRDDQSLAALRRDCALVLCDALPASARLADLDPEQLVSLLLASLQFRAFSDVAPALRAARRRGLRLVVVSNWDVSLHEVLRRIGVDLLVDGVLTSAEVGARKPSPDLFRRALEIAGVGPAEAVHVGDSLVEDVAGARAVGIQPILIARGSSPVHRGVRVITSLQELVQGP